MPWQPVAARPGVGRCNQSSVSGWLGGYFLARPHPKPLSPVVVIVKADSAILFSRIRLVHVERDFARRSVHVLVVDDFLVLLDGVVLGRLHVQLPPPSALLIGN